MRCFQLDGHDSPKFGEVFQTVAGSQSLGPTLLRYPYTYPPPATIVLHCPQFAPYYGDVDHFSSI